MNKKQKIKFILVQYSRASTHYSVNCFRDFILLCRSISSKVGNIFLGIESLIIMKENYRSDKRFNNKARKFFKDSDYNKALSFINKAIELSPNKAIYYNNKGLCLKNLNEYEEAIEYFTKAIELNPNKASYYNNKGLCLKDLSEYEEAIEYFTKAIELNPNKASYYNNKGSVFNNPGIGYAGKYEKAIEYFTKAIELNPNNVEYLYNKSSALDNFGKHEEAKECFEKAREIENPNNDMKINLPFEILPSGSVKRKLNKWIHKVKDINIHNKRHEISTFLMNFKPDKVATGLWKEQGYYIIMIFDKNDERVVIAEAGVYGNATYCYLTDSFDDQDWINVFILDKQAVQDYPGVERIFHHDFEDDLQSWKNKIREKLED